MGEERLMFYLAGVFSSLQESYAYHVPCDLPRVGLGAVTCREYRSLQALQGVWVVTYKKTRRGG